MRAFWKSLSEEGWSTLKIGGTISWIGVLNWRKRREWAKCQSPVSSTSWLGMRHAQPPPAPALMPLPAMMGCTLKLWATINLFSLSYLCLVWACIRYRYMLVFECAHVCTDMCTYACECVRACKGQRLMLGVFSGLPYTFVFWDKVSHWVRGSSIWLEWLANELQGSSCTHTHTHVHTHIQRDRETETDRHKQS